MDRRLLELETLGHSQSEIAGILSEEFSIQISRDCVKNRLARVPRFNLSDKPIADIMPYFNRHRAVIEGTEPTPPKVNLKAYLESLGKGKKRVLVLEDMHIPFQDEEKLQKAIDIGRGCDIVIRNGDVVDMFAISKFEKEENVPLEVELDGLVRTNEYTAQVFDGVPIIDIQSNHPWRVKKAIQMPTSLQFLVKTDVLEMLARPFPTIHVSDDWWVQVNSTIFCHAEKNSVVPVKAADDAWSWFKEWQSEGEMGIRHFDTLVQGHTHSLSAYFRSGGKIFEGGSLCKLMKYTRRGIKYRRPQTRGAVVITWRDGVADLNASREYVL